MLREIFSYEIPGLKAYGFFHFFFVILTIIFCYIIYKFADKHTEQDVVKVVFCIGLIFLFLEVFKQLFYNDFKGGWKEYSWGYFPFQLCSTPLYLCLLTPLFKGRFRHAIYSFLGFVSFIAGITVMVIADTVIIDEVAISVQSLLWHGTQCVLGVYLCKTQNYGQNLHEVIPGLLVFLCLTITAVFMNYAFEVIKNMHNLNDSFNMFYISPYYKSDVLILGEIWDATSWPVALVCYILGVSLGSCFIYSFAHLNYKKYNNEFYHKEA